ncbi:tonsoku-like protein [Liolophura sinensis]|uniref:tonsoku-like protein n=1 Tax=Liolophura sinensis TaxID=3198878 RepID=UPI0031591E23
MNADDSLELERLRKEKKRAERKDNLKEVAKLCNVIGELLAKNGLYQDAIAEHYSELALSEALDDRIGSAIACRKIGECFSEIGDFEKALSHQNRYLELAKVCGDTLEEQRAWATLGRTYLLKSEGVRERPAVNKASQQAEKAFIHSLEVCEKLKGSIKRDEHMQMKARLLLNLGLIYDGRGELKLAADYIKQAIDKNEKFQLFDDLYRCQFALSCMYQRHGNLSQALRQIDEAQKCAKKLKDKQLESEALTQKSLLYSQLGDYSSSRRTLKHAHKLGAATVLDGKQIQKSYNTVVRMEELTDDLDTVAPDDLAERARLYEKLGDLAAGIASYKQAIHFYLNLLDCSVKQQRCDKDMIPVYVSLAQTYADDKQYDKAIEYYNKELKCRQGDNEQMCRTMLNIAEAEEMSGLGYSDVMKSYLAAFEHARLAKHRKLQVQSLRSLLVVQETAKRDDHRRQTEAKLEKIIEKYGEQSEDEEDGEGSEGGSQDQEDDIPISDLSETDDSCDETGRPAGGVTQVKRGVGRRFTALSTKRNEKGETPLHRACIEGNLRKVKKLVEQGHPLNPRDFCGWLPLHEAANHDFPEIVEYLLTHGAWINDRGGEHCGGVTPLLDAANCGNLDVMTILIDHGANLHAKDDDGSTALDCLRSWRERTEDTLSAEDRQKSGEMENRLLSKLGVKKKLSNHLTSLRKNKSEEAEVSSLDSELPDIQSSSHQHTPSLSSKRTGSRQMDDDSSDSDSEVYIPSSSVNQSESAKDSYKTAIAAVGSSALRRNSQMTSQRTSSINSNKASNSRPALVNDDEIVGDDWLIDDVRPLSKKRKNPEIEKLMTTGLREGSECVKRQKRSDEVLSDTENLDPECVEPSDVEDGGDGDLMVVTAEDSNDSNDPDIGQFFSQVVRSVVCRSPSVVGSGRPTRRQKPRQLKLTRLLARNCEVSTSKRGSMSQSEPTVPSSIPTPADSRLSTVSQPAAMKVKVRVKDKLLLIPVPASDVERPISWLAQQTSQRYYNLYGARPLVQLCTQDGAVLSPDDTISLVLTTGEEVGSVVESWDLPPLQQRYTQACAAHKTVVYRNIQTLLRQTNQTGRLTLTDLSLRPVQVQPVFRALQCQNNLTELHLQGNKIGDIGIKSLAQVLESLPNLSQVDLSTNQITATGLRHLAEAVEKSTNQVSGQQALQVLRCLRFDYNPLGDGCAQFLVSLIKQLPLLERLGLISCQLSKNLFQNHRVLLADVLKASPLTKLEVSHNHLGPTGVELLLKCLLPTRLTEIGLRATVSSSTANHISKYLENYTAQTGCVLERLDISDCHFTREDYFPSSQTVC